MKLFHIGYTVFLFLFSTIQAESQESLFLRRSVYDLLPDEKPVSSSSAQYIPVFGMGDADHDLVEGIRRYGLLVLDPGGSTLPARYLNEEQICYVLEGTGILQYDRQVVPIGKNDFIYLPAGERYSFNNPRERKLRVILMGYKVQTKTKTSPVNNLMIANGDEVPFQVLGQHGPTTTFQLLLGNRSSKRDRLAAAEVVNSLFMMDFAPGGTNIPHRHQSEEEIYFILRGSGEMVAGETSGGKENRIPAKEGDVFYFKPGTLIGFYSGTNEGEPHALILAVRSEVPE